MYLSGVPGGAGFQSSCARLKNLGKSFTPKGSVTLNSKSLMFGGFISSEVSPKSLIAASSPSLLFCLSLLILLASFPIAAEKSSGLRHFPLKHLELGSKPFSLLQSGSFVHSFLESFSSTTPILGVGFTLGVISFTSPETTSAVDESPDSGEEGRIFLISPPPGSSGVTTFDEGSLLISDSGVGNDSSLISL